MQIKHASSALTLLWVLLLAAGCNQADPRLGEVERVADTAIGPPPSPPAAEPVTTTTSAITKVDMAGGHCPDVLNALASCATAKICDGDISMYLPAASRSALIAMEGKPEYSEEAFDRYCLSACLAQDASVDQAAFDREVCGASEPPAPPADATVIVKTFSLRGKLEAGTEGVPLAMVVQAFGQPMKKRVTPYECGSAFDMGAVQEYVYPDFSLETDGQHAVIRSIKLGGGNKLLLSNGQAIESANEAQFKQVFGQSEKYGEAYRTSASPDGNLESAFDFKFDAKGNLTQVDYWIGC